MAKTKFRADFMKISSINLALTNAITYHNEGKVIIGLRDFISWASVQRGAEPYSNQGLTIELDETNENKVLVSTDDGKTICMTIEEIELNELDDYQDPIEKLEEIHNG